MSASSASYEDAQADAASGTPSAARYDRTPCPSSGKDAATHCTRWTGEPSRASDDSTEAHAPTRRSCSSGPSSAKLPPRSDSAAVSVRGGAVVHHAHVVPAGVQQPQAAQRAHPPPAPRGAPPGRPAHRDRQPLVARPARHRHRRQRAVEDEDADRRRHARRVGLPAQHEHAEDEPDRHGDDLPGPPPRQRAAALTGPKRYGAPPSPLIRRPLSPGGHAGGQPRDARAVPVVAHVGPLLPRLDRPDQAASRRHALPLPRVLGRLRAHRRVRPNG